jgi:hypothetical protein
MKFTPAGTNGCAVSQNSPRITLWVYSVVLVALLCFVTALSSSCGSLASGTSTPSLSPSNGPGNGGVISVSAVLPQAIAGIVYNAVVSVSGGQAPYVFSISMGGLPPGLTLDSSTGSISGIPSLAGTYNFAVTVKEAVKQVPGNAAGSTQMAIAVAAKAIVAISITPTTASLLSAAQQQFGATVSNTSNTGVAWSVSAGAISGTGLYTAPTVTSVTSATITGTSLADSSKRASATVVVTPQVIIPAVIISVSPTGAAVVSGGTQQFTATVSNTSNTAATWWVSAGTISASGLFTAPTVSGSSIPVMVTATSLSDSSKQASTTITVNAPVTPPAIETLTLPNAVDHSPYAVAIAATGGQSPYQWSIESGALPQGLQLDSSSGILSGTTAAFGSFPFTAMVTDAAAHTATRQLTLVATSGTNGPGVIPSTFFGLQSKPTRGTYPTVSFGSSRLWDRAVAWAALNPTFGSYNWATLDNMLAQLKTHGLSEGVNYTVGIVPTWASSVPADVACDFGSAGGCDLPADLNPDGTGTNATFIAFVQNLAQHANDPVYLQTHAHIKYWEPWNEWYRNPVLGTNSQGCLTLSGCSVHATYAQMVRMTEDLRCVITGKGNINGVLCNRPAIDSKALIVAPDSHGRTRYGAAVMENFLHCNASPYASSQCTTGDRGRNAVDILNFHFYTMQTETAEELNLHISNIKAVISAADLAALPLWSNEGGWGFDTALTDPDMQAAFVMRYYLLGWSNSISLMMWYEFDNSGWGTLYSPPTLGSLTPAGTAYQQAYRWMVGNEMTQACTGPAVPNLGVWSCGLTKPDGTGMLAVWDSSQSCASGNCTSSYYAYDPVYTSYSSAQSGIATVLAGGTVPIGAKPILLSQ